MRRIIFTKPRFLKSLFGKRRIKLNARRNILFPIMCLFLLLGVISGVICAGNGSGSLIERLDALFLTDFENKRSEGAFAVFSVSFSSSFLLLLADFLLGISPWGFFVLPAIPLVKGLGFGASAGYMYAAYKAAGIFYNILVVLPGAFISALALAAISKESFRFSWELMCSLRAYRANISESFRLYIIKVFRSLTILAAGAFADMIFSLVFSGLFSFS